MSRRSLLEWKTWLFEGFYFLNSKLKPAATCVSHTFLLIWFKNCAYILREEKSSPKIEAVRRPSKSLPVCPKSVERRENFLHDYPSIPTSWESVRESTQRTQPENENENTRVVGKTTHRNRPTRRPGRDIGKITTPKAHSKAGDASALDRKWKMLSLFLSHNLETSSFQFLTWYFYWY